jgi:O-antigen/teichoic acid export membrane protein
VNADDPPEAAAKPIPVGAAAAAATTGASVLRGSLWHGLSLVVPQLYTLGISIAAARYLGPDLLGRQSFISFVALSTAVLVSGALPFAVTRYVGETVGAGGAAVVRGLIRWAWRIQVFSALAGCAILLAIAFLGASPRSAWVLAAVVTLAAVLHNIPTALLIGLQRWRQAAIVGLVTGLLSLAAIIGVLAGGYGITGMFAVEAGVSAVNLLWTGVLARRALRDLSPVSEPPGELRRLVARYTLLDSIGVLLTLVVWRRSELFFLEHYSTDRQIALYSIPFAMVAALGLLPGALGATLTSAVATLFGAGSHDRIRSGYGRALRLILLVSMPLTAGGLALGPALIVLLYGKEFAGTKTVLLVLLAGFPLVAAMQASMAVLAGLGRILVPTVATAIAAAVNVGLDFALIPGRGAVGAAIANLCGQVVVAGLIVAFALRSVGGARLEPRSLAGGLAASAAGGLVAWLVVERISGGAGFVAGLAAGVAVFFVLAALVRVIPLVDTAWLEQAVGGRLGPTAARLCRHFGSRQSERAA